MKELALTPEIQVGEIVVTYPATMRMLEALGIDYCCGGKRTLQQSAEEANVPLSTVIAVLQTTIAQAASAMTERDWQNAPLDELMAHIVEKHHAFMSAELPRLEGMLALVARVHGPNHADVLEPL